MTAKTTFLRPRQWTNVVICIRPNGTTDICAETESIKVRFFCTNCGFSPMACTEKKDNTDSHRMGPRNIRKCGRDDE